VSDIDYWEINEAFCIVVLNCIKELGINRIALTRWARTAIGILWERRDSIGGNSVQNPASQGGRYGLATACVVAGKASPRLSSENHRESNGAVE